MTKKIDQYKKGDAPMVREAYLKGVILQDGTFNCNGLCLFITDALSDREHCTSDDLYIEVCDD